MPKIKMDFTLNKYSELLDAIGSGDYRLVNNISRGNILRHDVDRDLMSALKMAKLEARKAVKTTYYFRVPKTYNPEIINAIYKLGHEIGYHYEVLDKAKGNFSKAIGVFIKELALFERWKIKTICMHGNPLSKWDNRHLWNRHNLKKYGLKEAYLSVNFSKINYFTDTGRAWNGAYSIKDKTGKETIKVENTDELISQLKAKRWYILVHPCRWHNNPLPWFKEMVWQNVKNVGKRVLR